MNLRLERLALPFGLLLALGCGARSTLDTLDEEAGGGSGGDGGATGSGGKISTGDGGNYGGGNYFGGGAGGQAGSGPGGSPVGGKGGTTGGAGGTAIGGRGGTISNGGTTSSGGKTNFGGTTSSGGQTNFGGTTSSGGKRNLGGTTSSGGQTNFGGTTSSGGKTNTGGSVGGAAGNIAPDSGVGGGGGIAGRDGGPRAGGAGGNADSGAGDATGGTSGTGGSTCPGIGSNEELIDDLNDGNRYILSVNGRVGSWHDSDDAAPGGSMYPDPVGAFAPTDTGDPCRKYAAYVKGSGFSDWGADFWFGLGSPYDASKYRGISFWARIDSGTTPQVRVSFPDKDTFPDGGICKTNVTGPTACYNHFGSTITLSSDWKKYTVSFSQISQDGGGHAGPAFDPTSLYEVLFQIPVNATFSIWIDDVAFTL